MALPGRVPLRVYGLAEGEATGVQELLVETGRGLGALWSRELLATTLAAAAVVGVVVWSARRADRVAGAWPLLVVGAVALGVRGRAVVPLLAAGLGWLLLDRADTRAPGRPGVLLVALLVTGLGLFGTLPETEEAVALVAAIVVVGVAGMLRLVDLDHVTGPQVGALLGLLVWICLAGDGQRVRALMAGLLCVAMFAAVAALLDGSVVALLVLHVVVTLAASRWVGLADDTSTALLRALPVVVVAVLGVALLRRTARRSSFRSKDWRVGTR